MRVARVRRACSWRSLRATLASPVAVVDVDWIASAAARVAGEDLLLETGRRSYSRSTPSIASPMRVGCGLNTSSFAS